MQDMFAQIKIFTFLCKIRFHIF